MQDFQCRPGCAACCITISITSTLPFHPNGKVAGEMCRNLDENYFFRLWGTSRYPIFCQGFPALPEHCGHNQAEAFSILGALEHATQP